MQAPTDVSSADLVKRTGGEIVELVRNELELAARELRQNAHDARLAGWLLGLSAGASVIGLELVLGGIVAAGRRHPIALAMLGCAFIGAGIALGSEARQAAPPILERTRQRVSEDAIRIEEELR